MEYLIVFPQMANFFLLPGHNFYPGESASLGSMTGPNYQVQYQLVAYSKW